MSKIKPSLKQPQSNSLADEELRRERAEREARGIINGRTLRRAPERKAQIGIKTTEETKKRFDRLRVMTGWSYTEIFEYAMEAAEEKFERDTAGEG
jgi:hypothetical protein